MVGRKIYIVAIKPFLDRIFALILLFALSPVLVLLLIVLSFHFSGKPFFTQRRVGRDNTIFWMLKFRSMKENTQTRVSDKERLTKFGKFIRKMSIDELPQLVNVLKGDMSLVGPRPLLDEYLPHYSQEEGRRHELRPGITGLAQVNGRNQLGWGERLKMDVLYVEKVSFWLDAKILLKTCLVVMIQKKTNFKDNQVIAFTEYASKR